MAEKIVYNGSMLWDEILKAIVDVMPEQLFPLFKEVYGKDYPKGTPITLLATESSTYLEDPDAPPSSRLSDIALLVNGTDYYHLECQMLNEQEMVIRMIAYDLHFSIKYTAQKDEKTGGFVMRFPRSAVIYPAKNKCIPEFLKCRIIFQDNSEHIYQIPTVRIQSYSLREIQEKHLTLFVPYLLLKFRPRLNPRRKSFLTKKELTDYISEVILMLKEEQNHGYLTDRECNDYINLFRRASERIFVKHPGFRKEVDRMTKPLIELPSVIQKRLEDENKALLADLADKNALLADKNAELARMRKLLEQHHIPVTL